MKKLFTILLVMLMFLGTMAGCSGGSEGGSSESVQVGIVLPTKDEPRWLQDEASFSEALSSAGFTSEVMFSQGSSETELKNVEALIEKGVQVIVMCPQDAEAAGAAVQKAHEAGIKVISYDRIITNSDVLDYVVGFDSVDVGVKQGQYLIDKFAGQTNVPLYLYAGAPTDFNAFIFFAGAWSVLSDAVASGQFRVVNCPAIADYVGKKLDQQADYDILSGIIGTITTNWDFSVAKTLAEANLSSNGPEDKGDVAILAPNDGTARSIADAFEADGDVTSWVITGQDAEKESLQYILDGKQSMTVWKNTTELANATCDVVTALLNGEEPAITSTVDNGAIDVPAVELQVNVLDLDTTDIINELLAK